MAEWPVVVTVQVEADSPEEAYEVARASMPQPGGVRLPGTVGVLTRVLQVRPYPALWVDADFVREEVNEDLNGWSPEVKRVIAAMSDDTLSLDLGTWLDSSTVWDRIYEARDNLIHSLAEDAGITYKDRRVD